MAFVCDWKKKGRKCGRSFPTLHALSSHRFQKHKCRADGKCLVMLTPDRECGMEVSQGNRCQHDKCWHRQVKCRKPTCEQYFPHNRLMLDHYDEEHKKYWSCKNRKDGCQSQYYQRKQLIEHELTCNPSNKPLTCGYQGCQLKFTGRPYMQIHLYLIHSLNAMEVKEYLGIKEEEESSENEQEEEEEEVPTKRLKVPLIPVPLDSETGSEFQLLKFGNPNWHFKSLDYGLFRVFYHYGLRVPIFTYQILFPALFSVKKTNHKDQSDPPKLFRVDRNLAKIFRRSYADYEHVEYDRGHVVRFFDYIHVPVTASNTCLYTNVLPMLPNFNKSIWKRIEHAAVKFALKHTVTLVVTVGLFCEPVTIKGPKNLPIPNRFCKIFLGLNAQTKLWDLTVYNVPHNDSSTPDDPLSDFFGNLLDIEDQLNTQLFPELKHEQLGEVNQRQQQSTQSPNQLQHSADIVNIS